MMTLFDNTQLKNDLFQAYYDARKNKRNTVNALRFELNLEHNLFELYRELIENRYEILPSVCFIVTKPVKREVFAANFRDRIIHHLIINKLNHIFENQFIFDSYSCRVGKGTLFGIKRIDSFIKRCSQNYSLDTYILKLDIQGFFMNINKDILKGKIINIIQRKYKESDKQLLIQLCSQIIENNPTQNCIIKSEKKSWVDLPKNKSLFYTPENCGLPIGNLTSQVFANVYLNDLDKFVKEELQIKYYGRYVDDFVIIHNNKAFLKQIIPIISDFLKDQLFLTLHPRKIYLQNCLYGVKYLGAVIKPYRIYVSDRTKTNFYKTIIEEERLLSSLPTFRNDFKKTESRINSYFGLIGKYKTYKIQKYMMSIMINSHNSKVWLQGFEIRNNAIYYPQR